MTAFVVVNPASDNGRTGRDWPKHRAALESVFPLMTVAISHARGEIAGLVRQALQDGHLNIIAMGGDGTINEAVNGFFDHGIPVSPDAVFGFVACGAACDFARNFGIAPGAEAGIARLRSAPVRRIDVGRLSCLSLTGAPLIRHFVNVASFGFSARVAARVNRAGLSRLPGHRFATKLQSLLALIGWRSPRLRLMAPGGYDEIAGIAAVAVANGRWFGGGVPIAPDANPGDGLLDIMIVSGMSRRHLLKGMRAFSGGNRAARMVRAPRLTAAPTLDTVGPVSVETDGESAGLLPATFEIYPNALNLRC
jgi:diacylglycerol kinase (ATP)